MLDTLAAHPLSDLDRNGVKRLEEYDFSLFAPEIVGSAIILEVPGSPGDPLHGDLSYYRNRLAVDLEYTIQRFDSSSRWVPAKS
ncbi:hypothetical protein [Pelagicoccus sp. SDUM812002]|uniref:hypothetical protein n=1 Tax=Pelagicoccus sp. SDUM812002 TaxID=3041266 RepID=UPI0028100270|nr:hypothetical protein [Pelagicoccus sp. SDUM812002]MDQ8187415.1 hypothetical protein [Pelagicoccus sp. SDUM812002]